MEGDPIFHCLSSKEGLANGWKWFVDGQLEVFKSELRPCHSVPSKLLAQLLREATRGQEIPEMPSFFKVRVPEMGTILLKRSILDEDEDDDDDDDDRRVTPLDLNRTQPTSVPAGAGPGLSREVFVPASAQAAQASVDGEFDTSNSWADSTAASWSTRGANQSKRSKGMPSRNVEVIVPSQLFGHVWTDSGGGSV